MTRALGLCIIWLGVLGLVMATVYFCSGWQAMVDATAAGLAGYCFGHYRAAGMRARTYYDEEQDMHEGGG